MVNFDRAKKDLMAREFIKGYENYFLNDNNPDKFPNNFLTVSSLLLKCYRAGLLVAESETEDKRSKK